MARQRKETLEDGVREAPPGTVQHHPEQPPLFGEPPPPERIEEIEKLAPAPAAPATAVAQMEPTRKIENRARDWSERAPELIRQIEEKGWVSRTPVPGDVVRLRSGGTLMTVYASNPVDKAAHVIYLNADGELTKAVIPNVALVVRDSL